MNLQETEQTSLFMNIVKTLKNFGMHTTFMRLVRECYSTAKFSILVEGEPTREFSAGSKEPTPGGPLLFNLIIKGLSQSFHDQEASKLAVGEGCFLVVKALHTYKLDRTDFVTDIIFADDFFF